MSDATHLLIGYSEDYTWTWHQSRTTLIAEGTEAEMRETRDKSPDSPHRKNLIVVPAPDMDESTGLPKLSDPNQFWRIDHSDVKIMAKSIRVQTGGMWFWKYETEVEVLDVVGCFRSETSDREVIVSQARALAGYRLHQDAVHARIRADREAREALMGDYPPKKLETA